MQKIPFILNEKYHVSSHLSWALTEEGQSGLETLEESLGLVAQEREMKEQLPVSQGWVIPHTAAILLRQSNPIQVASA